MERMFLCLSVLLFVVFCHGQQDGEVVAQTPSGRIVGSLMSSRRGRVIHAYRGIRYAKPPVGELRFKPPVLIRHYAEEVDARADGPACPQPAGPGDFLDEDCLRLNVYTPVTNKTSLPVVVYLHAGGFYSGSARSDVAGPQHLLDHDLVLVTINYRLGSLGFLSTGDAVCPGNNGFKDQVAALRWVRRNVAAFGGDRDLVTLAGYSAGAISVALHALSPISRVLVKRAISMSGSPFSQVPFARDLRPLAHKQARLVNCSTASSEELVSCLRTVPWQVLGESLTGFAEFSIDPILIWTPVIEGEFGQQRFLPRHPLESIRHRTFSVPFLVSQTTDEFFWEAHLVLNDSKLLSRMNNDWYTVAPSAFLLPSPAERAASLLREEYLHNRTLKNDEKDAKDLGKLYGDAVIGFGAHRLAKLLAYNNERDSYYFQFDYRGNQSHYRDPGTGKPTGVAHHDELIYLLSLPAAFAPIPVSDSRDSLMVDKLTTIIYNFAKNGDPNPLLDDAPPPEWPPLAPHQRNYLRIGDHYSLHTNLFEERFNVWERLYPIEYDLAPK